MQTSSPVLLIVPVALLAAALGGCATIAEPRVRTALVDAGLSPRHADCMAGRMVDRLSITQLRKLERLRTGERAATGRVSIAGFVAAVRRVGDSEVVAVTTSSAALCATGLAF